MSVFYSIAQVAKAWLSNLFAESATEIERKRRAHRHAVERAGRKRL